MGAATPATHSAKASGCRVLQLFLSCLGEAPGGGWKSAQGLYKNSRKLPCSPPALALWSGGAVHVHSIVTTQ